MAFLANILKILLPTILNWIYEKVSGLLAKFKKDKDAMDKIEKEDGAVVQKLEQAQSSEQIKDAAKDLSNNF